MAASAGAGSGRSHRAYSRRPSRSGKRHRRGSSYRRARHYSQGYSFRHARCRAGPSPGDLGPSYRLGAGILFFGFRVILAPWRLANRSRNGRRRAHWPGPSAAYSGRAPRWRTQRAFLMIGLVLLARTAISMRLVGWAAILVLVLAPERLLGASFQMSFVAVIALVAVYEVVRGHVHFGGIEAGWPRRPAFYISCVALTTVLATLATAPFAAYCFNRLALYGLAANIVAVPITALWIMPWGIVALALMPFGAEALGLAPMGLGIEAVIAVARKVAGWPDVVALAPAIPNWCVGAHCRRWFVAHVVARALAIVGARGRFYRVCFGGRDQPARCGDRCLRPVDGGARCRRGTCPFVRSRNEVRGRLLAPPRWDRKKRNNGRARAWAPVG